MIPAMELIESSSIERAVFLYLKKEEHMAGLEAHINHLCCERLSYG